jgi:YD repeat-containing protein
MKKTFVLLFVAAAAIVGCKKEKDNGGTGGGDSKILKRFTRKDDSGTKIFDVAFDGNKRLTSVKSQDNSETTNFTYDPNGNVTKAEYKNDDSRDVYEFTYSQGVPSSATHKSYTINEPGQEVLEYSSVLTYTVSNGQVTKINEKIGPDGEEINANITYSNGNVSSITTTGLINLSISYTYGNKKPIFPVAFKYILDLGSSLQFFAKNEVLTERFDGPGTELDRMITNQITYDSNGYVLTVDDGETKYTMEY